LIIYSSEIIIIFW